MKVKKLIKLLEEQPEDFDVIMSSDAEGNYFNKFEGFSISHFTKEEHQLEIQWRDDWDEQDQKKPYPGENCIVFFP